MAWTAPTLAEFKARFDRDFAFAVEATDRTRVRDTDITRAITQATTHINHALWIDQASYTEAALLLVAHFLCQNLLASSQGLGGTGSWLTNAKAASNLSESFAIPDRIMKSPVLAMYSRTLYGQLYLQMVMPFLTGHVATIEGGTTV